MVSEKNLSKLKIIIKEEYGRDLSNAQVSEIGNQIVGYYKGLIKLKTARLLQDKDRKLNKIIE